jgi:MotA/TolQ/ExbB proton channel family
MRHIEHFLVLAWLLLAGLTVFALVIVIDTGLMADLLSKDRSYVSAILIAMYGLGAGHALYRSWLLSCELQAITAAEQTLSGAGATPLQLVATRITTASGTTLPPSFLSAYVNDIVRSRATTPGGAHGETGASGDLLEAYAARMRGEHEFGWFMIDLMLKVGFVGTLIGFIWMLSSVSKQAVIDAASMQQILKDMSYGMSIALNTTLTSLVTATLLSAPYYLLNRGLDELLECTVRLTQVDILPRLNSNA